MPELIGATAGALLKASMARSAKWASSIAFAGGVVADVLNPLAPFAAWIALAAAGVAALVAIALALRMITAERAFPALVFAAITAAIAGGLFVVQKQSDAQDGVIASLLPAIAELQQSMGIVTASVARIEQTVGETQAKVEKVEETTARVEEKTTRVEENTEKIAENQAAQAEKTAELQKSAAKVEQQTTEIAQNQERQQQQAEKLQETTEKIAVSIETIAEGFKALAAQGGVIADPKRPDEYYHNARIHELGGDMLNARRDYLAFADFGVDAVDPYLRFATLLRVQDGKAGAREVFGSLAAKNATPAFELVHALQFEPPQRAGKLDAFIAANPEYAPAYYFLSQEYSEDRLGFQTLADKRAEAEALNRFLAYEPDGRLLKYFIDQTLLADWLDAAHRRVAALGSVLDPSLFMPKIVPMRSNQDWMITVSLPEPATGISWRVGADGPFTETGFLAMNDQTTGKPMPNPSFALPATTNAATIAIKYLDLRGRETGPFDIRFDPDAMLRDANKQLLEQFWTSWIAFDASGNRGLVYYTQILSYRCAVKAVRYGLNGAALDKALDMPPCNPNDPYALPDDTLPYFKIGDEVTSMSVQITYADGTQSPVRVFQR